MRFEGPAVMQLQAAFSAAWAEATGELVTGPLFYPTAGFQQVGTTDAGLLYAAPTVGSTPAERFIALSISGARQRLYITNSYFVPDDDFRRLAGFLETQRFFDGDLVERIRRHFDIGEVDAGTVGLHSDLDVVIDHPFDGHEDFH